MQRQSDPGPTTSPIRAKSLGATIATRVLGRADAVGGASWAAVLVEDAGARISSGEVGLDLKGPVVACLPWDEGARLSVMPGATALFVNLTLNALASAIGYRAESNEIRSFAARPAVIDLTDEPELRSVVASCLRAVLSEQETEATAAGTVAEAYMRILLIRLWRAETRAQSVRQPGSPRLALFNRFAALVEMHFRDRWTVQDYARALGMSRDRLGDISRAAGGQSPKAAIDARAAIEARLLLQYSTHSIEQIAALLGFASTAQFSRFFTRIAGTQPSRFRIDRQWRKTDAETPNETAIYEWP